MCVRLIFHGVRDSNAGAAEGCDLFGGNAYFNAVLNGNRAMCRAFSDPRYNQSPYSRTVVMGE
jgi:hypothetical protein